MTLLFCCTNLDLYSGDDYRELERHGVAVEVAHCLGLCHLCALGKTVATDTGSVLSELDGDWAAILDAMLKERV